MTNRSVILVLGMHRSGTSAATRMLNLLGADLSSNLLPPVEGNNAKGFWESRRFYELNDSILESLGSSWDDPVPAKLPNPNDAVFRKQVRWIKESLLDEFSGGDLFVVKDPRICHLAPLWLDAIREIQATPLIVLPVRNPLEVAASLSERDNFAREKGLLLWLRHTLQAELYSRGERRCFISFEQLLHDWRSVAGQLAQSLRLEFKGLNDPHSIQQIDEFLEPSERHHQCAGELRAVRPKLAIWVIQAADCFQQLVDVVDDQQAVVAKLDRLRRELSRADRLFTPVLADLVARLRAARSRLESSQADVARLDHELADTQSAVADGSAQIELLTQTAEQAKGLEVELSELKLELDKKDQKIVGFEQELTQQRSALQELDQLQRTIAEVNSNFNQTNQLAQSLDTELQATRQQLKLASVSSVRMQVLEDALSDLQGQRNSLRSTIDEAISYASAQPWLAASESDGLLGFLEQATEQIDELVDAAVRQDERLADAEQVIAKAKARGTSLEKDLTIEKEKLLARCAELQASQVNLKRQQQLHESGSKHNTQLKQNAVRREALMRQMTARISLLAKTLKPSQHRTADVPVDVVNWRLAAKEAAAKAGLTTPSKPTWRALLTTGMFRRKRLLEELTQLFDPQWYQTQYPDVVASKQGPFDHFLKFGLAENRRPQLLFDPDWYVRHYPLGSCQSALEHYVRFGRDAGHWPNPLFDPAWYATQTTVLPNAAFEHYLKVGWVELVSTHPLFDPVWYLRQYADVLDAGQDPLAHYLQIGCAEGRDPHPLFSASWYLASNPDVSGHALLHYLEHGWREGRSPHPLFDLKFYTERYPDIANAQVEPLSHYIKHGFREGRQPNSVFDASWYAQRYNLKLDYPALIHYIENAETHDPSPLFSGSWYRSQSELRSEPLAHFLLAGKDEAYQPHPLFDLDYYRKTTTKAPRKAARAFLHFVETGGAQGCSPHGLFDSLWYLKSYPEVAAAGFNPLLYYIEKGWQRGHQPNSVFDSQWYAEQVPELSALNMNPLEHYVVVGAKLGLDVAANFSCSSYVARYEDLMTEYRDPVAHYLHRGIVAGLDPIPPKPSFPSIEALENLRQDTRRRLTEPTEAVPFREHDLVAATVQLIAFYLPQFHPIPENDHWWGKGFTEWANVTRVTPAFVGHEQPKLPGELGFYDLRLVENQRKQAQLAKNYGVSGFCYHYYWFAGKKLLDLPLKNHLQDKSIDLPFCVCWANENWTRAWDGLDQEVLIAQDHSPQDDLDFIEALIPVLKDPRYLTVNGKVLLVVYRPSLFPDPVETARVWKRHCQGHGLELLLACAQFDTLDPRDVGFDVAIEFPPHKLGRELVPITKQLDVVSPDFSGRVLRFEDLIDRMAESGAPFYPLIRGVAPGWDNSARRPDRGTVYHGASPRTYGRWLSLACQYAAQHPVEGSSMVFINAWNEWAEGAMLEPDRQRGYAMLDTTHQVLTGELEQPLVNFGRERRIIFVSHDAYNHGAQQYALHMVQVLKDHFHYDVDLILREGGDLVGQFEQICTVYRFDTDFVTQASRIALLRRLNIQGVQAAFCNTSVVGDIVELLAKVGIRTVCMIHELPVLIREYGLESSIQQIATNATQIVVPAELVKRGFLSFAPEADQRCVVNPQGLFRAPKIPDDAGSHRKAFRQRFGWPQDCCLILAVGWADHRKGTDLFVEVAKQILMSEPNAVFLWVGCEGNSVEQYFSSCLQSEDLKQRIRHEPRVDNLPEYYAAADIYLLTSREDPFPSVVLEAMSYALPVVAFADATGCADLIHQTGSSCVVGLDTKQMAAQVQALISSDAQRISIGNKGRELVARDYGFREYVYGLLDFAGHTQPTISVLIPNYNYAHYLPERLASVYAQSHPIYEVIVLDDASTDNSLEVLERLRKEHGYQFRLVTNESNSGSVFAQWNKAVELAKGELIWIAEADDRAAPMFLDSLSPSFADSDVVLAYCESRQIGLSGEILAPNYRDYLADISAARWRTSYKNTGRAELAEVMAVKNSIPNVSGVVFRAETLRQVLAEHFDSISQFTIAGDWATYFELLKRGSLYFHQCALNDHRRNPTGVTISRFDETHFNEVVAMQEKVAEYVPVAGNVAGAALAWKQRLVKQFGLEQNMAVSSNDG